MHELNFLSFNERDTVKGWVYTPTEQAVGIVHIVHGLGEHSRRYLHMINTLLENGYIVCADDHVGHGKTAYDSDTFGDFGDKGYMTTIEDEHTLRKLVISMFPDLPYFMFGHSWGSVITRNYIAKYADGLTGAIICGTIGGQMVDVAKEILPKMKAEIDAGKGKDHGAEYMGKLFEGMTDRYENPNGPNDWICSDPGVVAHHGSDPFNNLSNPMTVQSIYDFCCQCLNVIGAEWAEKVPKDLPIFNIAGDLDPVGGYGEGVYQVSNWLWDAGVKKIKTKLYSGYRHEIHNEPNIKNEVEWNILEFLGEIIIEG